MTEVRLDNNVAFAKECVRRNRPLFIEELKHVMKYITELEKEVKNLKKELDNEEGSL